MKVNSINNNKNTVQDEVQWSDVNSLKGHHVGPENGSEQTAWRTLFLYVGSAFAFGVLMISSINLQLVRGNEYLDTSQQNRLEEHEIQPDRGLIYDRNGEKIAVNVSSFNLMINPREAGDDQELASTLELISQVTKEPLEEIRERFDEALEFDSSTQRVLLVQDVSRDEVLKIRSHSDELSGVWIDSSSKRKYVGGKTFSHVVGYTGEVTQDMLDDNEDLSMADIVGLDGVEYTYDKNMRGIKGIQIVEIDAAQNVVAEYINAGSKPVPGDSLYLTIDSKVQKRFDQILTDAMDEYEASGAAGVIMDVDNGEILALNSVPSYDNNKFVGGISKKDYEELISDDGLPLFNRVIAAQEPPGSTFKPLVASAALQEGSISRDTIYVSNGVLYADDGSFLCQEYHRHSYGRLNLIGGIAKSSNIYFYNVMSEMGIDNFKQYADFFGVERKTGIDLPGESEGRLHSLENKQDLSEDAPWIDPYWYPGDDCNAAIGQGINSATPIQLSVWASIIANGGEVYKPVLAHKWEEEGNGDMNMVDHEPIRDGKVDERYLEYVRNGMRESASSDIGIVFPFFNSKVPVAAKTGTAEFGVKDESGEYTDTHAWVMGFFPADEPEYSFVVFLEGGGASNNAATAANSLIGWMADEGYVD